MSSLVPIIQPRKKTLLRSETRYLIEKHRTTKFLDSWLIVINTTMKNPGLTGLFQDLNLERTLRI